MANYRVKVSDFIYPREVPVRIITTTAAGIVLILVMLINIGVGLFFLVNIGLLFFLLYQNSLALPGRSVRVSPNQFERIYRLGQIAAERLDIDMPPIYIQQDPALNAFASGFWGNYYIMITSAMVEGYTDEELLPIIGHEFTHIKGNHVILTNITQSGVGLMKFTWWLQMIIKYMFAYLSRCQEYTCDRGGLIASGNIQAFVTAFTKLAVGPELFSRINIMEFYRQAMELDRNKLSILGEIEASHPYTVNRIREAIRFYRSDKYRNFAAMQGKMGTSTLQGSLGTGDLMQRIVNKAQNNQMQNQQVQNQQAQNRQNSNQFVQNAQNGFNMTHQNQNSSVSMGQNSGRFCRGCGSQLKVNASFCAVCGTPVNQTAPQPPVSVHEDAIPVVEVEEAAVSAAAKICPNCGEENSLEAVFCNECGQKL